MLHYIIQTIAFQLFFLIIYDVFLKKETFFNWNRAYLLITASLSLILPFVRIESFKNVLPQEYIISLPEIILGQTKPNITNPIALDAVVIQESLSVWEITFYIGVIIASCIFLYKLTKILLLIFKNPKISNGRLTLIKLLNSDTAFSFFRYVFLGEFLKKEEKETIIKHELVHVKQLHSIDLLFFELLRILFWFNPLVYMYQNRVTQLHEFIADAEAVKNQMKSQYYQNLLSQVFDTKKISFINPFFKQSLIKKRIVMLQKSKSKQIHLLKYVLLVPMVLGILVYTSCSNEQKQVTDIDTKKSLIEQINQLKLVIEAKGETIEEEEKQAMIMLSEVILNKAKFMNSDDVPFATLDQVPVFPGCEELPREEQKSCTYKKISNHVGKNFNTKIANEKNLKGRQRINVVFKINKEGNITDVRSRAPHPALEAEAIRVIKTLPKIIPGEHKGKIVNVPYSLPIIFEVEEAKTND